MRRLFSCLLIAGLGTFSPASATDLVYGRLVDGQVASHLGTPGMVVKLAR